MNYYLINLLIYAAVDAMACLGLSQQFGIAGVTNFGFIIFQAAGGYAAAVLAMPSDHANGGFQSYIGGWHLPFPLPWLGAAVVGGALALPFTFLVGRRLRGERHHRRAEAHDRGHRQVELARGQGHDQPERDHQLNRLGPEDRLEVGRGEERVGPQEREDDDDHGPQDEDPVALASDRPRSSARARRRCARSARAGRVRGSSPDSDDAGLARLSLGHGSGHSLTGGIVSQIGGMGRILHTCASHIAYDSGSVVDSVTACPPHGGIRRPPRGSARITAEERRPKERNP